MNREPNLPFDYRVVRSRKRRTASLMIDKGRVEVRVPALADESWIESWVRSKADWVLPRLQQQTDALEERAIRIEMDGRFFLQGQAYRLRWKRGPSSGVEIRDDLVEVTLSTRISRPEKEAVAERLQRWLVREAQEKLARRCRELGREIGLEPREVRVKNYRRKWGQCDTNRVITLNWRILHLKPELQDYILVHELCHLAEMNHGPAFWRRVAARCPDYRLYRRSLMEAYPFLIW
ncbi:M48 family metallopeptidase [Marinobacterium sp. YM272]|uniref:M48 family metallopeptidase n=1 Tax=Marinobacterium sp. YM272 TaxID=3421654 RepID=UPI003D7F995B